MRNMSQDLTRLHHREIILQEELYWVYFLIFPQFRQVLFYIIPRGMGMPFYPF
jgi:hypothetical protein